MLSPNHRRHNAPVHPEDWKEIRATHGLFHATKTSPSASRRKDDGERSKVIRVAEKVEVFDGFCVVTINGGNPTTDQNAWLFDNVKEDGLLHDGTTHPVTKDGERYYKLSPWLYRLNKSTIPDILFDAPVELLKCWNSAQDGEHLFILLWRVGKQSKPTKEFTPDQLKALKPGDLIAPDVATGGRPVLVVTDESTHGAVEKAARHMGGRSAVEVLKSVGRQPDAGKLLAAPVVVVVVGGMSDEVDVVAVAAAVNHRRLHLLADGSSDRAKSMAKQTAARFGIDEHYSSPALTPKEVADAVRDAEQVTRPVESDRNELTRLWQQAEERLRVVLASAELPINVVKAAVLQPVADQLDKLAGGEFEMQPDVQKKFFEVARHVFKRAKRVYALNTDKFTTFWSNLKKDEKREYLVDTETVRLFLYSTRASFFADIHHDPADAEFTGDLHFQYEHYRDGDKATLLVGNLDHYKAAFGVHDEQDVAVVEHASGRWYRFSLKGDDRFGFSVIQKGDQDELVVRLTKLASAATGKKRLV